MDSRDDAGFDGDETLDWLWDLDDRYDVGPVDGGPTSEVAAVSAGSGVKKHLRKPRVRAEPVAVPAMVAAGAATEAASVTGRPKESEESDQGEATGAVPIPIGLPARSGRSVRDRLVHDGRLTRGGVAAALLLVLGLGGIAFALSQSGGGKSHLSSNVAISPTTDTSVTDTTTTAPGTPSQPPTSDTTPVPGTPPAATPPAPGAGPLTTTGTLPTWLTRTNTRQTQSPGGPVVTPRTVPQSTTNPPIVTTAVPAPTTTMARPTTTQGTTATTGVRYTTTTSPVP